MEKCDVVVLGAGPYGLSCAAHLRRMKGLEMRVFGEVMSFWSNHMPKGMVLRSPRVASHLSDPDSALSIEAFQSAVGRRIGAIPPPAVTGDWARLTMSERLPVEDFIEYGHWFARQAELPIDSRMIKRVEPDPGGYRLTLDRGEAIVARKVIVAGGVKPFARKPKVFEGLPRTLVSHTSEEADLTQFRDREVLIVGGGQSALEGAALCHEAGAHVTVAVREPQVRWFGQKPWVHTGVLGRILYGPSDVGPALVSQLTERPTLFRSLPRSLQDKWGVRSICPGAAAWVKERLDQVQIYTGRVVESARTRGERLCVRFNDGSERVVDHVMLGTGYQVNVAGYPFLSASLLERIVRVNGFPRLDRAFESSAPGLHFIGAAAAWSYGPLMRFVAGAKFASETVAEAIARRTLRPAARQAKSAISEPAQAF
jgi:cation diffusion facilitator CzcD-associated flavoprotein CzcO